MNDAIPPRGGDSATDTVSAVPAGVSAAAVLGAVARDRTSRRVLAATSVIAVLGYALLLPGERTGHVAVSNYGHLTGQDIVFSVALGLTLAAVLTVQVFVFRHAAAQRGAASGRAALGGLGALAAIIPCLSCTAVLPAVVGAVGLGAAGSASIMHGVTPHALAIQVASLLVLVAIGWWSLRRLGASGCVAADGRATTDITGHEDSDYGAR